MSAGKSNGFSLSNVFLSFGKCGIQAGGRCKLDFLGKEEEEEEDCYFRKGVAVVSGKERCADSRFYPKMRHDWHLVWLGGMTVCRHGHSGKRRRRGHEICKAGRKKKKGGSGVELRRWVMLDFTQGGRHTHRHSLAFVRKRSGGLQMKTDGILVAPNVTLATCCIDRFNSGVS